jgi:hypothetical protein
MVAARERLQAGAPDDRKNDLMPARWFEAWSAAALASDPVGSKQEPPVLRSPARVFQDNRNYWDAGKPYYDPERIKIPTLVVVAEWDRVIPPGCTSALPQAPEWPEQAAGPDRRGNAFRHTGEEPDAALPGGATLPRSGTPDKLMVHHRRVTGSSKSQLRSKCEELTLSTLPPNSDRRADVPDRPSGQLRPSGLSPVVAFPRALPAISQWAEELGALTTTEPEGPWTSRLG